LQAARERPGQLEHLIAPVLRILGMSEPLVADGHPARETNATVDNDRPPVIPAMEARPGAEFGHAELLDAAALAFQLVEQRVRRVASTETVEQHAHLDAVRLPFDQRRQHLIAEGAVLPDVHTEVDCLPGRADAFEQ
jgi:hypothetical protein